MTDFQLLKDTFDKMGIAYRVFNLDEELLNYLSVEQGLGATGGYMGFGADFSFNPDGSFHELKLLS